VNQKHETDLRLAIALTRASEFSDKAKRASSGDVIDLIAKLNRYSRSLHRHAELACNYAWYCNDPRNDSKACKIEAKARALCQAWGIGCEIKYDPRAGCGLAVAVNGSEFYLANSKGN